MTHINNKKKESAVFTFFAHREGLPEFSGYVVYDYTSHARLESDFEAYMDMTQRANDTLLRQRYESRFKKTTEAPDDCNSLKKLLGRSGGKFGRDKKRKAC